MTARDVRQPWAYLEAEWRREMIAAAKEATAASGFPVYDHHPLCSNFTQPVEHCWQCQIITSGATEGADNE